MHVLKATDLTFTYSGDPVLNGIDLTIFQGERVGIIGPNGGGKTTCFHLITGLLKPTAGSIEVFGQPVQVGKFQPKIGLVFQYPDDQLFSPTVEEDIAFGPRNMGLSADEVEERVKAAVELTGITDLRKQAPHHLSGGQKRMVAIAGIKAMHPELIIYDEPSANLDIRSRRRLINFIKNSDETVLVSSHDLELMLEVSSRVIILDHGKIVADGPTAEIMADERLMEAHGLEKPHSLQPHANLAHLSGQKV